MVNTIPFTEYVLPNGRMRPLNVPASHDVSRMALSLLENEYVFECETLRDGSISLTIVGLNDDGNRDDLDIEIASNIAEREAAIERLVRRFYGAIQ